MSNDKLNRKLKILLVTPLPRNMSFGGIGSWAARFVDAMSKSVEIRIVNSTPVDSKGNDIARSKNIIKKLKCNLKVLKQIRKEIHIFNPDIVHINSSCTPLACARDNLFLKTIHKSHLSNVLHCHCNVKDQIHNSRFGLFFLKRNLRLASHTLTLNKDSYEYITNLGGTDLKCSIMPNFLSENTLAKTKTINEHIKNISFVGHLVKQKGIEDIKYLASEFPELHFILVSGYTEEYPNSYVLPSNIEITGTLPINDVFQILDKSDVFLLPTYSEGFSYALLEAMARGVPIITTNVGANADMLENKGGCIVSCGSTEELKNALIMIDDCSKRKQMSAWNIHKVKSSYTENTVLKLFVNLYYELSNIKE